MGGPGSMIQHSHSRIDSASHSRTQKDGEDEEAGTETQNLLKEARAKAEEEYQKLHYILQYITRSATHTHCIELR